MIASPYTRNAEEPRAAGLPAGGGQQTHAMNNATGITDAERQAVKGWFEVGAKTD